MIFPLPRESLYLFSKPLILKNYQKITEKIYNSTTAGLLPMKMNHKQPEKVFTEFIEFFSPSEQQLEQFKRYADYLLECNKHFNLTAVQDLSGVFRSHFQDSLALSKCFDLNSVTTIADVGTGAGFPGLPLKIMFPHLKVVLIEVTRKKQEFLADVVRMLGLTDVEICGLDWRTFVKKGDMNIDLFVSRAAIDDLELTRIFRPACVYNKATLVYWASKEWQAHKKVEPLITRRESYRVGHKDRQLIFMNVQKPV